MTKFALVTLMVVAMICSTTAFVGVRVVPVTPLSLSIRSRSLKMSATSVPMPRENSMTLSATASAVPAEKNMLSFLKDKKLVKKIVPQMFMMFCILFNYTILRDTKDVLVVTAPGSGAEIIPFLKTYVQLPGAIAFAVLYGALSNRFSQKNVFYGIVGGFLAFFASFASVIYPARAMLHPNALADAITAVAPAFILPVISIFRNWTYAMFYLMAELWGSVVLSLLFWGFANDINTVDEAKSYYPLFGLVANLALILSGQYVRWTSVIRAGLPDGVDKWGHSLKLLMSAVVAGGATLLGIFTYMQQKVIPDPECVTPKDPECVDDKKVSKPKMSAGESIKFLSGSAYIRDLATLVVAYGISINLVEVTWKSKLKAAFPDPNAYSAFMGNFSTATGIVTLCLMLMGRFIFKKFGWGVAAMITPVTLLTTGIAFFSLSLFPGAFAPVCSALGTSPLMLAVLVGALQNIFSKGAKYSLFDPCKEMAYIPLDSESKTKGKAAIDVICNPLGKSGGSFIQQFLIGTTGSLAASTPYLGGILGIIIAMWLKAANNLSIKFKEISKDEACDL